MTSGGSILGLRGGDGERFVGGRWSSRMYGTEDCSIMMTEDGRGVDEEEDVEIRRLSTKGGAGGRWKLDGG